MKVKVTNLHIITHMHQHAQHKQKVNRVPNNKNMNFQRVLPLNVSYVMTMYSYMMISWLAYLYVTSQHTAKNQQFL